jgi:hypothetical protein
MRTELERLNIVAAKWALGLIPGEALPRIATDALEAGLDTPSLRLLAGEMRTTLGETGPIFDEALDELGVPVPDRSRAALVVAREYATQISDGTVSPYEGAREIFALHADLLGSTLELGPFAYWVSEWQEADTSDRREYCDTAIRAAAHALLRLV